MKPEIRLAAARDAADLARLNDAFNGVGRSPEDIRAQLARNGGELVAVAVQEARVVGFACAQVVESFCYPKPHGEITELFVEEGARRIGAGAALVAFLERMLEARGVSDVRVLTGRDNGPAITAYVRSGYAPDDKLVLNKRIGQPRKGGYTVFEPIGKVGTGDTEGAAEQDRGTGDE
ncbi:GNAT family N-acetyltransferase [Paenibacillus methanolicus]|uniref:Ribosomal protein S18 acetylase RimI-like enzyme n=1 Tax=Paenibacillus methanolicus TaxID=582686 RepID=A0A5S5C6S3_9BACL|nr:GNAT family N-acetyltransferase [Paenibacillus methanolicus]TYP74869.1 ribosomal protein S18 acetylase RimI-like enzyme [Paenibacillus methanolicus]